MKYLILLISFFFIAPSHAQDLDNDGLDDAFELAIAKRFAPEWRFHKSTGSGSNQNEDETHYPSSIEYLNQFGLKLQAHEELPIGVVRIHEVHVPDIRQISNYRNPHTGQPVTAGEYGNTNLRIGGFPEYLPGQPNTFPTYFHCYSPEEGVISIGYLMYFPMDYKGRYCLSGVIFGGCPVGWTRPARHRGDWEGVNVVISGATANDISSLDNATIKYIKFSGHGSKRYINGDSDRLRTVHQTHPKIYVTWGAHTPYSEPGSFENFRFDIIGIGFNWYDDYFFGNGLVAQSWQRPLLNLGEVADGGNPMPGMEWIKYKGLWGPDNRDSRSKSPPSPPNKSAWGHDLSSEHIPWEEAIRDEVSDEYWARGYTADCHSFLADRYLPDPNYNCDIYLDHHTTCPDGQAETPHGHLPTAVRDTPQGGRMGIFPGNYRVPGTLTKPMTLRAIEGPVILKH